LASALASFSSFTLSPHIILDHIQFDFSQFYLYIYGISFPATNIAKKHPTVEDTVDAKLLADSHSHAEQFRL